MLSVKSWIVIFEREYYNVRVFGNDPAGDLRPRYQPRECISDVEKSAEYGLLVSLGAGCYQKTDPGKNIVFSEIG